MTKVNRVSFGLLTQTEVGMMRAKDPLLPLSRVCLALPFVGKDTPSVAAEFAQPDIAIGLTTYAYRLQGMRQLDLDAVLDKLQYDMRFGRGPVQLRPECEQYRKWVEDAGGEVCGSIRTSASQKAHHVYFTDACLHLDSRHPESSSGAYGETVWRDLSGQKNDISMAPALLARLGGQYDCTPGAPLRLPPSASVREALTSEFTLHVLTQCRSHDAEASSHFPVTIGGIATIGTSKSRESLSVTTRSTENNTELLYPPGMENKLGALRLHQLVVTRHEHGRELKCSVNGAVIGLAKLGNDFGDDFEPGPIVIGEASKDGSTFSLDGSIFLVLLHARALTVSEMQMVASKILDNPGEWGAERKGDSTYSGAELQSEISCLRLEDAAVLLDSRTVTHSQLLLEIGAVQATCSQPALGNYEQPTHRSKDELLRKYHDESKFIKPMPLLHVASKEKMENMFQGEFTCTAVVLSADEVPCALPLLGADLFYGFRASLSDELCSYRVSIQQPQVHSISVELANGHQRKIKYFIDGTCVKQFTLNCDNAIMASTMLHRLECGNLLGGQRQGEFRGIFYFFLVHSKLLPDDAMRTLSGALVSSSCTKSWAWGGKPRLGPHPLSRRGWQLMRTAAASRAPALSMYGGLVLQQRPRVQPLYVLDLSMGARTPAESLDQAAGSVDQEHLLHDGFEYACLPGWPAAEEPSSGGRSAGRNAKIQCEVPDGWEVVSAQDPSFKSIVDDVIAAEPWGAWMIILDGGVEGDDGEEVDVSLFVTGSADTVKELRHLKKGDLYDNTFSRGWVTKIDHRHYKISNWFCKLLIRRSFSAAQKSRSNTRGAPLLLHRSQAVVQHYLRTLVFPKLMVFQKRKISASGNDLASNILFPQRIGFTGVIGTLKAESPFSLLTDALPWRRYTFRAVAYADG